MTLIESADDDDDVDDEGASGAMVRSDNGRLKVGLRWSKSPDCPLPGHIAPSVHTRLQVKKILMLVCVDCLARIDHSSLFP